MKSVHSARNFVLLSAALAAASSAQAGNDAYSFGGSCPSQGAWTQMALAQTKNITSIIEKLKDNPDCKGIESVVQDLGSAAEVLKLSDRGDSSDTRIESLPGEIDALRKVLATPGGMRGTIQSLLFKKTITAASIGGAAASALDSPLDGTSAVRALYSRTKRATEYGIAATERVFQVLPKFDQCLMGQPDQAMGLVSAAVKIGASFASSGEGVGMRLGNAISSFVTMMRNRNFTLAMRKNHETEFWMSVSCLLETTTKNYCDAHNGQELLDFSQKEYLRSRANNEAGKVDPNYDNPLEGYYLLVRELPLIAQWLRSVKLGTDPKLTSDAQFQISAIEKVNEMWKLDKELRSSFAQEIDVMRGLSDVSARRNKLFSILQTLVASMGGGSDGYSSRTGRGAAAEFFTNSMNSLQIPFYLIGMDEIPKACRATDDNINPKPWDRWMQSSGEKGYVSQFDDPDALARTVESRMNLMIKSANEKAGVFFRQRLVIDLLNLVNKTLVGQNITVRQSLKHVDRYLERFNTRLTNSFDDDVMRGSVLETRQRIQKVLSAYNGLAKYGKSLKAGTPLIDDHGKVVDGEQAMLDGAKAVIDAVFGQLNVLYQSDVFLTNRLTTFIERDFAILMKNSGGRLSEDQSQLMKIAQEHLLEKMIDVHGLNPTSAQNDLANAQVVNVRNLQGVEEVFSDTMYVMLEELNQIAKGKPTDAAAMAALMQKRYEADKERYRKMNSSLSFYYLPWEPYQKMVEWFFAGTIIKNKSPDLYQQPFNSKRVTSGDTPFGDFARFRAQICAQTLAFESRTRFLPLCQGAVLKSFYSEPAQITSLDLPYDSYLPRVTFNSQITADPYKSAKAKCALNDYNIRNWVRLLEDRDRSADSSEEE